MSRMGKLIASKMIESKKMSAHVQSFVEVDVTNLWDWREKIKNSFFEKTQEKLTFTPLFMLAIIKALRDFPILNSSIQGESILQRRDINLGMATSLSDGNLIVPVIKNADHLNLIGLAKAVNDLSNRARNNQLLPEEVQGGTYTVTNVGNFGSIMGTPIINQPQVGIIAIGVIRKLPSVIETFTLYQEFPSSKLIVDLGVNKPVEERVKGASAIASPVSPLTVPQRLSSFCTPTRVQVNVSKSRSKPLI